MAHCGCWRLRVHGKTRRPESSASTYGRLRLKRHVSVTPRLPPQTGFSPSFISQLENGQVSPSLGSLQKIAEALGVTLGEFFAAAGDRRGIPRRAPPDRRRLDSTWTDAHLEALGPMGQSRRLEPVLAVFGPGGKSGKHLHSHPHEEFAFVVKGRVTLSLRGRRARARARGRGDSARPAPHRWENRDPRDRRDPDRVLARARLMPRVTPFCLRSRSVGLLDYTFRRQGSHRCLEACCSSFSRPPPSSPASPAAAAAPIRRPALRPRGRPSPPRPTPTPTPVPTPALPAG